MVEIISHLITENGNFPNNNTLPLVILKEAIPRSKLSPERYEQLFSDNLWPAAWRNGLYSFHHYHASAHEVLGVYSGWVEACFGGPNGVVLTAEAGDVMVIPAGVSHCNTGQSSDFQVVGGYPIGQKWDMMYGKSGERPAVDEVIARVPLPEADPVLGKTGGVAQLWLERGEK